MLWVGVMLFGVLAIVFGVVNLAITRWLVRRRSTGRALPRLLRSWEPIARYPRLAVVLACSEIVVGAAIIVATLATR